MENEMNKYEVMLMNPITQRVVEYASIPVEGKAIDAKMEAINKTKLLKQAYDEDKYDEYLVLYCYVKSENGTFYLDSEGNEELEAVNWLD